MLVQAENRGYGFRRNFYAIRKLGRLVALGGILIIASLMLWRWTSELSPAFQVAAALGLLVNALIMTGWFMLPSADRVRAAGDKYAYQLLQGAVSLASDAVGTSATAPATADTDIHLASE